MTHSLYTNMATPALLNADITAAATSIVVQSGQGALFPAVTGGNYFYATLFHKYESHSGANEIVKCTARSGDTLTVTRAQGGTTAGVYYHGDKIEIRLTAEGLEEIIATAEDHIADTSAAHAATAISNTPAGTIAATTVQAAIDELDTEKAALAGATFTGAVTYLGAGEVATNTGYGTAVLAANTTGNKNTAVGYQALQANTDGTSNTAMGYSALIANTGGDKNIAVGELALAANTTGDNNTAIGYIALAANTTGTENTAVGRGALGLGTTGVGNTAVGYSALACNTSTSYNTAVGYNALAVNIGTGNVALGYSVLDANTTGSNNIAVGYNALGANTTGTHNVAMGTEALAASTDESYNVAIGYGALRYSTDSASCVAIGTTALGAVTLSGSHNVAVGDLALAANTSGANNTAVGDGAGAGITTGAQNTTLGISAGDEITTGSNNVTLGYNAGSDAMGTVITGSNQIFIGNNSSTNATIKIAWTVTSDARDKTNFAPVPHGLAFVQQLKPVTYQYVNNREEMKPTGSVRYGFTAQSILALEGANPVIINNENPDSLKYNESSLIPVLVNAIQELAAQVKELQAKLESM